MRSKLFARFNQKAIQILEFNDGCVTGVLNNSLVIIFSVLCIGCQSIPAEDRKVIERDQPFLSVRSKVSQDSIDTLGHFTYTIEISFSPDLQITGKNVKLPNLDSFSVVSYKADLSSTHANDNSKSNILSFEYGLLPLREGTIRIEPAIVFYDGKNYPSKQNSIEVKPDQSVNFFATYKCDTGVWTRYSVANQLVNVLRKLKIQLVKAVRNDDYELRAFSTSERLELNFALQSFIVESPLAIQSKINQTFGKKLSEYDYSTEEDQTDSEKQIQNKAKVLESLLALDLKCYKKLK